MDRLELDPFGKLQEDNTLKSYTEELHRLVAMLLRPTAGLVETTYSEELQELLKELQAR